MQYADNNVQCPKFLKGTLFSSIIGSRVWRSYLKGWSPRPVNRSSASSHDAFNSLFQILMTSWQNVGVFGQGFFSPSVSILLDGKALDISPGSPLEQHPCQYAMQQYQGQFCQSFLPVVQVIDFEDIVSKHRFLRASNTKMHHRCR